ncbi:MAG: class I SAM-dependent methyltransferase, partial [Gammaproteobacteria bacterium]|nr:class I SAM-dependent methyltransferase [Gammaproteobacteria bacterium]
FDVTGIDFNPNALAVAERAAAERGVSARFIERDMRAIDFDGEFDVAINYWSSFGYFENEADDLIVAKRVAKALKRGGRFLVDLTISESLTPVFRPCRWQWIDDDKTQRVLEEVRWDFNAGRIEADWTFIEHQRIRSSRSSLRIYAYRELCDLLRAAGFTRFEGFDSFTGKPFAIGSRRLSLVASLA